MVRRCSVDNRDPLPAMRDLRTINNVNGALLASPNVPIGWLIGL
jgi:hypothetical protein